MKCLTVMILPEKMRRSDKGVKYLPFMEGMAMPGTVLLRPAYLYIMYGYPRRVFGR